MPAFAIQSCPHGHPPWGLLFCGRLHAQIRCHIRAVRRRYSPGYQRLTNQKTKDVLSVCKRYRFALRNDTFCLVKRYLLRCKRIPFAMRLHLRGPTVWHEQLMIVGLNYFQSNAYVWLNTKYFHSIFVHITCQEVHGWLWQKICLSMRNGIMAKCTVKCCAPIGHCRSRAICWACLRAGFPVSVCGMTSTWKMQRGT